MENKQIALIVLLILIAIFILIMSLKLYSFLKEIENKKTDNTSYSKFSINLLEQTILLGKGCQYILMKLTKDKISYYNNNNDQLVYQFKTDQNNNWKCQKYLQKDNKKHTFFDPYSNQEYRIQDQSEELQYFSFIQIDQNKTYYYNQQITQQELTNGGISVLDAYIMHLNYENWDNFLQTDFKKINILFLPSSILDQTQRNNNSKEEIEKKYKQFLFQFSPINYKIELLYEKVFFTYQQGKRLFLIEFHFQKSGILVHCIGCSAEKKEFLDISKILTSFLLKDGQKNDDGPSICISCNLGTKNTIAAPDYYMGCERAYDYSQLQHPAYIQNAEENKVQQLKSHIQNHILKV